MVAGADAAGLEPGSDGSGFGVQLRPVQRLVIVARHERDEAGAVLGDRLDAGDQ